MLTLFFVQIHKTGYFECLISIKHSIINKQKRAVSAASALVDHMLIEHYLKNWVPRLQVLHSFVSNGSTWYVHLKVLARCVNSILYLQKKKIHETWCQSKNTYIEYIYLNQSCINSFVLISSNLMWNIRNEVEKTFVWSK